MILDDFFRMSFLLLLRHVLLQRTEPDHDVLIVVAHPVQQFLREIAQQSLRIKFALSV